jgi:hypothetical protein
VTDARSELHAATDLIRAYQRDTTATGALAEAIDRLTALVALLREGDEVLPAALTNLSAALRMRSPDDLNAAIRAADRSVALTGPDDAWYGSRINNRGAAFRQRYQLTSVVGDLRAAVQDQVRVVDEGLVPASHLPMLTNNIAQGLRELWEITLDRDLLRQAAARHRTAVRLARRAGDPADLAMILHHAGITIRHWRPTRQGFRTAIALQEEAATLTGPTDIHRPARMASLAWTWRDLSRLEPAAAATAVVLFDCALGATAAGSAERTGMLLGRAESRERLGDTAGALDDYDASLAAALNVSPITVFGPARQGASLAVRSGDLDRAMSFCRRGLGALDSVLAQQILRRDQRSWQRHAEQLAADGALLCLRHGAPAEAVGILEHTRLRELRLLAAAARLDPLDPDSQVHEQRSAVQDWLDRGGPASDEPLDAVLGIPTADDPAATPGDRHTVYLVSAETGGAIICVHPDGSMSSRLLPHADLATVSRRRRMLRRAYDARTGFPAALQACGAWLGRSVVRPLLDQVPAEAELIVVTCGPFAELPLAAARTGRRYPLLGLPLVFAVSGRTDVSLPTVPQHRDAVAVLGSTSPVELFRTAEAEALTQYCSVTTIAEPDPQAVLRAIAGYPLIHFSTHGRAGRADAVETAIHLPGGREVRAPDILRARFTEQPLVFLASCDTAAPDPTLPDQTFGPPAALLHAGASAVVAPLFAVTLPAATLMSARFYHELIDAPTPQLALARAQRWLADATPGQLSAFLLKVADAAERRGVLANGLRAVAEAVAAEREPIAGLNGAWLWSLFTINV